MARWQFWRTDEFQELIRSPLSRAIDVNSRRYAIRNNSAEYSYRFRRNGNSYSFPRKNFSHTYINSFQWSLITSPLFLSKFPSCCVLFSILYNFDFCFVNFEVIHCRIESMTSRLAGNRRISRQPRAFLGPRSPGFQPSLAPLSCWHHLVNAIRISIEDLWRFFVSYRCSPWSAIVVEIFLNSFSWQNFYCMRELQGEQHMVKFHSRSPKFHDCWILGIVDKGVTPNRDSR